MLKILRSCIRKHGGGACCRLTVTVFRVEKHYFLRAIAEKIGR